jgi:hypothetical protein
VLCVTTHYITKRPEQDSVERMLKRCEGNVKRRVVYEAVS